MASGRKTQLCVTITDEQQKTLTAWQRSHSTSAGLARRARCILLRGQGYTITDIGRLVGMGRKHVIKWIKQYQADPVKGLYDKPRPGRKPVFSP